MQDAGCRMQDAGCTGRMQGMHRQEGCNAGACILHLASCILHLASRPLGRLMKGAIAGIENFREVGDSWEEVGQTVSP
jgi:hypothetical protein